MYNIIKIYDRIIWCFDVKWTGLVLHIISGPEEMTDFKLCTYTYILVIYYTESVCVPVRIFVFVFMDTDKMPLKQYDNMWNGLKRWSLV